MLAFALFQLPLGILLDRFGPRRVQAALVALGALGAAIFSIAENLVTLTIARAIIGVAFAGGLMSGFKAGRDLVRAAPGTRELLRHVDRRHRVCW